MLKKAVTTIILIAILLNFPLFSSQAVHAQSNLENTVLSDLIGGVLGKIQVTNSTWNAVYGQVFGLQNESVFDEAILQALNSYSYGEVIFIARLAEINQYSSAVINESVRAALTAMPRAGSLPLTYSGGNSAPNSFLLYDRYLVHTYRYAQQLNVSGWNLNQAYNDFAAAYMKPPQNSESGEMLWINPAQSYANSFNSRYYDEHAETLAMFLEFAYAGIDESMQYADDAWLSIQDHWGSGVFGYKANDGQVECEMGPFAQIIGQYRNLRGEIPFFDRVTLDLENKLLKDAYDSNGWGVAGVIKHMDTNRQLRLQETLGAMIALHMLYPFFSVNGQRNFRDMLETAGHGLVSSSLYHNGAFRFLDNADAYTNDEASFVGAMTLFLDGITPQTGYLAINASEERCQDMRTCFPVSQWHFNYADRSIRIPVIAGTLSFRFGLQSVTHEFDCNGVYDIQFSDDWNTINSTQKVADIATYTLQPVTLQAIPKDYEDDIPSVPTSTPTATPTQEPTPAPAPSPTEVNPAPPSPSPVTTEPTPSPSPQSQVPLQDYWVAILLSVFGVAACFSVLLYVNFRRKKALLGLGAKPEIARFLDKTY